MLGRSAMQLHGDQGVRWTAPGEGHGEFRLSQALLQDEDWPQVLAVCTDLVWKARGQVAHDELPRRTAHTEALRTTVYVGQEENRDAGCSSNLPECSAVGSRPMHTP